MLPSSLTIIDVETTGLSPIRDRIIEVGLLKIENNTIQDTFTSLINPEMYISPHITAITGISKEDVEKAPLFEDIAAKLQDFLSGSIFVAHNARFDYGFIRNEFKRVGRKFSAKQLCTVKLSHALFPHANRHNLDAIRERFGITCERRHRALDDAKVLWDFLTLLPKTFTDEKLSKTYAKLLQKPSLPPHLSHLVTKNIPEGPGVYLFYGKDGAPLYVGKSKHLKERIFSHFTNDSSSAKDMHISQQITSLETIPTAGELGALITESTLIKKLQPQYNRLLRHSRKIIVARQHTNTEGFITIQLSEESNIPADSIESIVGIFKSKKAAKEFLLNLAKQYSLCRKLIGLETGKGACFGYRLSSCKGACINKISSLAYNMLLVQAVTQTKIKKWPFHGPIVIKEINPETNQEEGFVLDKWCLLGSSSPLIFDVDTYKILLSFLQQKENLKKISVLSLEKSAGDKEEGDHLSSHDLEEYFDQIPETSLGF